MKKLNTLKLNKTKGNKLIKDATDVFNVWIDSDAKKLALKEKSTKAMNIDIFEMDKDATFKEIFTQPKKQVMTQEQVIDFCKNHKSQLRNDGYATFFLLQNGADFFVASVSVRDDGRLFVLVYSLDFGPVWDAKYQHRTVVPQLAPSNLEPESLSPSESLTLNSAIKVVKEAGYIIFKQL